MVNHKVLSPVSVLVNHRCPSVSVTIMKLMPMKLSVVPSSSSLAVKRSSLQRNGVSPSSIGNNSKKVSRTEPSLPTVLAAYTNQTTVQSPPGKREWLHKYNNKFDCGCTFKK